MINIIFQSSKLHRRWAATLLPSQPTGCGVAGLAVGPADEQKHKSELKFVQLSVVFVNHFTEHFCHYGETVHPII